MNAIAYVGELTVKQATREISLGVRRVRIGCVVVLTADGALLFRGDWLDAVEWASAHKEDIP
jgi:hypothetical protein